MSIKLGSTSIGSLYLGSTKIGAAYLGSTKIYESSVVDPLNPLGLPPYTIRVQLKPRTSPGTWATWAVQWTQVSSSPNVWDGTRNDPDWSSNQIFIGSSDLIAILGFNATGITNFKNAFTNCSSLSSVCLFDTSAVTDMNSMFDGCSYLTNIPLFDTSSVTDMRNCFHICSNVQSGALALYQQASTQTTPPSQYSDCFLYCGSDTQTGSAELAQIPRSWGGTQDPYNPLNLPAYTLRLKYKTGVTPTLSQTAYYTTASWTQVSSDPNVWDCTCSGPNWYSLLENDYDLLEIMGANSTGVTNMANLVNNCQYLTRAEIFDTALVTDMHGMFTNTHITSVPCYNTSRVTDMEDMFGNCYYLTSVPLFDTHNVINMNGMFSRCGAIQTLPLFDTSNVTNMGHICYACTTLSGIPLFNTSSLTIIGNAFESCHNVASGALALYNQMSTQSTPPIDHTDAFKDCGDNTQTGAAELAQIPQDWGGTGA